MAKLTCRWPWAIGFGTTGFLLTKVAMTVTDEDIKASSTSQCPKL